MRPENQKLFFELYKGGAYFVGLFGSPGVGKTFLAMYKALEEVLSKDNSFKQVVVVRSLVQLREVGHLPGSLEEKLDPYISPSYYLLNKLIGKETRERLIQVKEKINDELNYNLVYSILQQLHVMQNLH